MASLARSLFALAVVALLQTACAEESGCTTANFGITPDRLDTPHLPFITYELSPIYLTEANSDVHIDDPNTQYKPFAEKIVACNRAFPPHAPLVTQDSPFSLDDISVTLGLCVPPPVDIEVRVTRYAMES